MTPALSIIIPAYNEADRIGPYLTAIRHHLDAANTGGYEVIVVDDGSADDTAGLVERVAAGWPRLRVLRQPRNQGKGAAVRAGVLASAGRRVLFADADGATPIEEVGKLNAALDRGAIVAAGSRAISAPGVKRDRNLNRAVAGKLFSWSVRRAVGVTVRDTQCGFKLMEGAAGRALFAAGQETGYLFDVELLALADRSGYPVAEVPVNWTEQPGSKVRLVRDSLRMLRDLWRLRGRLRNAPPVIRTPTETRKAA